MQQDLTKGSIVRHLLAMAAFIGLGLLFQTLYFLVDLYFVSRLGSAAIAGVSSAGAIFFLVMGLTQLISVGAMSLIAQAMGAQQLDQANTLNGQAMSLSLAFGAATMVVVFGFGGMVVSAVGADAATDLAALQYLSAFAPGMALMFPSAALGAALRAAGVVGPPMVLQTLTVILNAVLAPIMISGWLTGVPLGVAGAGWASTISAGLGFVAALLLFPRVQTVMQLTLARLRPDFSHWRRIASVGLPATAEFLLMFIVVGVVYYVIREFGAHAQAGFGVGSRIMQSIFLPVMSVAFAAAPIVGQNYGAKNAERVKATFRAAVSISVALMVSMIAFVHWRPELLLAPFTDDQAALTVAEDYLRIASLGFVASGVVFTCSSVFQGLGDTRPSLLASASRLLTFVAPALWLSQQPFLTLRLVWAISVASVVVQMLICLWLLRRQFRLRLGQTSA